MELANQRFSTFSKVKIAIHADSETAIKSRRIVRKPNHDKMAKTLYMCFVQCRGLDLSVNGPIWKEKALVVIRFMSGANFTARNSWLCL